MDSKLFIETVSRHIDKNFNVQNEFLDFFVKELNNADLGLSSKQAQHILNIFEYTSKHSQKSVVIAVTNTLLELGFLKED